MYVVFLLVVLFIIDNFQSVCRHLADPKLVSFRDLLEDNGMWPDNCLQDLSRKLGLQASGVREELITRLRLWHVSKHEGKGFQGTTLSCTFASTTQGVISTSCQ